MPEEPTAVTTGDAPSPDPNSVLFGDGDKITDRRVVESKYETLDGKRILWVKMDLVKVSVNVQDVNEYFDRRFVELPHLTDEKPWPTDSAANATFVSTATTTSSRARRIGCISAWRVSWRRGAS